MTGSKADAALDAVRAAFIDSFGIEATGDPGRYRAVIPPGWGAPIFPNGGVVSAIALRAMELELDLPAHTIRTSTTMFASKVSDGPIEIEVGVIRRGKRMSQLRASIRNLGDQGPGHELIAAFGEARPGTLIPADAPPADVGEPEDYAPPPAVPHGAPAFQAGFFHRIDVRRVKMFQSWEDGWQGGTAEAMRWTRYVEWESAPDILALVPLADTMPPAIGQYLGPGHAFFHAPSVDLTFHAIAQPESAWILSRSRVRWGGDGYVSAEVQLWDRTRQLVAYGTQLMLMRFPDPSDFV